ncbi:DNA-methyltransferase [Treponema endosymbiont of Eucomonympha sp.]|uniref:DNA-methyltransferase n=1 Tax=Treponema endosymbiont of Eucomonympha sp. TaxID=1580831 RepID=UPI000ACC7924|nr:site-specific DNA-methyltransferase [Treponema endosymbiont of Eucomonympha sp.]
MEKERAPQNRTITLTDAERQKYKGRLVRAVDSVMLSQIVNKTLCGDLLTVLDKLPKGFADLLVIDPPYNLDKDFNGFKFSKTDDESYLTYLRKWFPKVIETVKPTGSVYICGDWKSTFCLYQIMRDYTIVRNRITWQREKGRGAKSNWKNASEDIWFGTKSDEYYFDVEAVKQKRRVIAPYREAGKPKDWEETAYGNFRLTCPSNFWDDISIPYWSMPENTDHPTQKPEKLIAKLVLASCPENGIVFDPFLGSGTTSVVAKKLNRHYLGIEMNEEYCCWAEKRLETANTDKDIQGYSSGVFWERNTLNLQIMETKRKFKEEIPAENIELLSSAAASL